MGEFRYNDRGERYHKMNRFFLVAAYLLFAVMTVYLVLLMAQGGTTLAKLGWNYVLLIAFLVINTIVYHKNKATNHLKLIIAIETAIQCIIFMVFTPATFLGIGMMGVLAVSIPYYDLCNLYCFDKSCNDFRAV